MFWFPVTKFYNLAVQRDAKNLCQSPFKAAFVTRAIFDVTLAAISSSLPDQLCKLLAIFPVISRVFITILELCAAARA